jgi:cytochrome c oxidase subunit 4
MTEQGSSPRTARAGESDHAHDVSGRTLLLTWLALMVLAAMSLALRFAHIGGYGFAVALGIAAVKAVLVALVFMEIGYERPSVRFAFLAGVTLLAIMLALMVADVLTRQIPALDNPPGTAPRYRG